MFGVRGDFVVVFVVTITTAGAAAVVVIVLVVDVLVVAIVVDIVDVDGALLLITTLSGIDGTFAIEMLTSLKRFKWKSNCASAETDVDKKKKYRNKETKRKWCIAKMGIACRKEILFHLSNINQQQQNH